MHVAINEQGKSKVAVINSSDTIIAGVQDSLDLMASVRHMYDCDKMIIYKKNIIDDFFDLKTRIAGEILQKYTNYRMRLAIVGDFGVYTSKSLKDFIFESNKGNQVFFLSDEQTALEKLHSLD